MNLDKILIIQTAFLGDVILASPVWENLHNKYPNAQIDVLVKKGNESLLSGHPFIRKVFVFDKSQKLKNIWLLTKTFRKVNYDLIINLQRFTSSGIITALARGKESRGFQKNPMSWLFTKRFAHQMKSGWHEVDRNLLLISDLIAAPTRGPKLYPSHNDQQKVKAFQNVPYFCMAPTSVWYTKQAPKEIWLKLINQLAQTEHTIYLLGAPDDKSFLQELLNEVKDPKVINLAGALTLLQSAALMSGAINNFVNDSGPLHLASASNAPVTAFFCSTVPEFGFGPLSETSQIIEVKNLDCRPCGLHGHKACPKGHFKCGNGLTIFK